LPWRSILGISTRSLGKRGERVAAKHLKKNRYRILLRNARTKTGELDLVALAPDRETIVVVEVKSRRAKAGAGGPPPESSVTAFKRRKLVLLTEQLRARKGWTDRPVRIDVISVQFDERGKPSVRHFENAVGRR